MSTTSAVPTAFLRSDLTSAASTGNVSSLGKDDFLQLLVAQMQNQDPLEPMDNTDFIAQLAQFSSLEQMSNIADGIDQSNEWDYLQMQSINNVMAAGLIGKEVKASYSGIYFDGVSEPTISLTTEEFAATLEISITDANGEEVAVLTEEDVLPGKQSFEWDGRDKFGNTVPEGQYTVTATATDTDGNVTNPPLSLIGLVEAVLYRDGAAYFRVDGVEIPFGDVAAIGAEGSMEDDG